MDINLEKINLDSSNLNEDVTVVLKKKYDYHKKMDLVKRINKIKKKEYLLNIFNIIMEKSSQNDYTENTNGVFIFFHNLSDDTYEKLDSYVNNIYKTHIKSGIKSIFNTDLSDNLTDFNKENTIELENINKELSNKEKMIMRRKKYENYLSQNQE